MAPSPGWATIAAMLTSSLLAVELLSRYLQPSMPWYAQKLWHYPPSFPLCTLDVCFNLSRCDNSKELLVYTYEPRENPPWPATYFQNLASQPWHTADPEKACLFFVFLDRDLTTKGVPPKPHPNTLPFWNGGMNHVLISLADRWSVSDPPAGSIGNASIMSSDLHETTYRPGFDIAIPLPRHFVDAPSQLQLRKPLERKYFVTFKGTRLFKGEGSFRSTDAFRSMHNGKDVIVVTQCQQKTNRKLRKLHPEMGIHCDEDEEVFKKYEYRDLMNATFGLAPAGRSPSSYRFLEILASGTIPVLIVDNYVKPFDTLIQWQRCALQFPTDQMHRIIPTLRSLSKQEVEERQRYCIFVFNEFLKDDATLTRTVMRALKGRFYGLFSKFSLREIYPPSL